MKFLRMRKQRHFLLLTVVVTPALLLLLVLPRTTASTAPKWYQRRPKPPTPEPADDGDEQQRDIQVTKLVPGWLQRASNRTATDSGKNKEEKEASKSPPKRGFATFFFPSSTTKTNETSTTASSKKDLPKPAKASSSKTEKEKAEETTLSEDKEKSKENESSAVTKPKENEEAATPATPEEDEEPSKTMMPRGWFGSRSDKAPSNEQDAKADDESPTKKDGSSGEAAAPAATDLNAEVTPTASEDESLSVETTTANDGQIEKVAIQVSVDDKSAKESSSGGDTTAPETKEEPASPETAKEQPKQRRGWFQRLRSNKPKEPQDVETTSTTTTTTTSDDTAVSQSNQTLTSTTTASTITTANTNQTSSESKTATPSNNQTQTQPSPETQQQQQQQQFTQQQPQGGVIVMGQPSGTRYYYGRGRPMYPSQQQQQQQPGLPMRPPTSDPLAEILAQVLGTAMRLWFLTWLTKRMASQEEAMLPATQHYCWEGLNDKFQRDAQALQTAVSTPPLGVSHRRWKRLLKERQAGPFKRKANSSSILYNRTVVVVELNTGGGDASSSSSSAIGLEHLADVVTFLLLQQRRRAFGTDPQTGEPLQLEVVLLVNSPGGAVATYGLAAAQLRRLKSNDDNNISTTVCVDKYAASGGYMIASQADKLVAAPFATLGSVGVILEGLNFNELARRYGVHPLVLKAGESKNPISAMGPVSKNDLENEQKKLKKTHDAFIELVLEGRPRLANENLSDILDGSVFLGNEAVQLGLVDAVRTTDEYLLERITAGDRVLRLHRSFQHRFMRRPLHISPLDILPHLRSWANRVVSKYGEGGGGDGSEWKNLLTRFVQAGSWIGFAHHVISRFCSSR